MTKLLDVLSKSEPLQSAHVPVTGLEKARALRGAPEVILIGASTGGPQALDIVLQGMTSFINDIYVFVVLHTLAEFMPAVTHHVANVTSLPVEIACHRKQAKKGVVYFAPGDQHLGFSITEQHIETMLSSAAPESFCRPSVDFLFRSAAQIFGPRALAIVLSGMGSDGLAGSRAIVDAGGSVIVQDKASSVVWGMPGSVAHKDLASAILPAAMIAPTIGGLLRAKTSGGLRHAI